MSNLDNLAEDLNQKWKTNNGRVPNIQEVLAAAYDPSTKALRISGGGGGTARTDTLITSYPERFTYIDALNSAPNDYYGAGVLTYDTSETVDGMGSLRIETPNTGGLAGGVRAISASAKDYSTSNFALWVRSDDWSKVNEIQIILMTGDSFNDGLGFRLNIKQYLVAPPNNEWVQLVFNREQFTTVGAATWSDIRNIIYRASGTGSNVAKVWFDQFAVYEQATKGYVSLDFDDGWASTWDAANYMSTKGLTGSLHVIPELLGTPGYMTEVQVNDLARRGWDISGHNAVNLASLAPEQADAAVKKSKQWLSQRAYKGADIYAYPEGVNDLSIRNIVGRYYSIGRDTLFISQPSAWISPMNVHAFAPIESTAVSDVTSRISDTITKGTWSVITFHKTVASPASGSVIDYDINKFKQVVDSIISSNAICLPKSHIINKLSRM